MVSGVTLVTSDTPDNVTIMALLECVDKRENQHLFPSVATTDKNVD